jgi:hypothetical protein
MQVAAPAAAIPARPEPHLEEAGASTGWWTFLVTAMWDGDKARPQCESAGMLNSPSSPTIRTRSRQLDEEIRVQKGRTKIWFGMLEWWSGGITACLGDRKTVEDANSPHGIG